MASTLAAPPTAPGPGGAPGAAWDSPGGPYAGPAPATTAGDVAGGDVSRTGLVLSGPAWALLGVAALGAIWWIADHEGPALRPAAAAAVLVVVVLDAVSAWRALGEARLEVIPPRLAPAQERVSYLVRAGDLRRPLTVGVVPPGWATPREAVVLTSDGPTPVPFTTPWRGLVDAEVFEVSASGPLGLVRARRRRRVHYPVPLAVTLAPERHDLSWPKMDTARYGESVRRPRGDDLFRGVREYVRGDAPRSVHWPSTAHHRRLMIRETEGLGSIAIRVVVAFERPGPLAEAAVARAGWVVRRALAQGWTVELVTDELTVLPGHPPLRKASGPHFLVPAPPERHTNKGEVRTVAEVDRRLAAAVPGWPTLGRFAGPTRLVLPGGDQWR